MEIQTNWALDRQTVKLFFLRRQLLQRRKKIDKQLVALISILFSLLITSHAWAQGYSPGYVGAFVNFPSGAPLPITGSVCHNCASQADLQANALATFRQRVSAQQMTVFNQGTLVFVVSDNYPLSGTFRFDYEFDMGGVSVIATPIDAPDDATAAALDNLIFARSSYMESIKLPPGISPSDGDLISSDISRVLIPAGAPTINFWHGLTNFGQFVQYFFINNATGKTVPIYVGDTITVTFDDGSTMKFKLVNPMSTIPWQPVPNSYRPPPSNTNSTQTPTSSVSFGYPVDSPIGVPLTLPWEISFWDNGPPGSVTVGSPTVAVLLDYNYIGGGNFQYEYQP